MAIWTCFFLFVSSLVAAGWVVADFTNGVFSPMVTVTASSDDDACDGQRSADAFVRECAHTSDRSLPNDEVTPTPVMYAITAPASDDAVANSVAAISSQVC